MPEIPIGRNETAGVVLAPRHGRVAGAAGTGTSVSPMGLAEGYSRPGVPCVPADVKGDLAGLPGDHPRRPDVQALPAQLRQMAGAA